MSSAEDTSVTMVAYQGKPARKISLTKAAPFGWAAAIILALTSFMDRIEQSILAGVLPSLKDDFGWSDFQLGSLNTGAGIAGVILLFLSARIASQVNRTKALAVILLSWSLLSFASGIAVGFAMLLGIRILLGAAGAFNNPLAGSLLGDYYPRSGRSRAYGLERLAYYIANPVGVAAGAAIAAAFGWRAAFFVLVIPGVIVAGLVLLLKEPVRGVADRLDAIKQGVDAETITAENASEESAVLEKYPLWSKDIWNDFKALLRIPTLRAVAISQAALFFGLGGILFFTPLYLVKDYGVGEAEAGSIAGAAGGSGILVGIGIGIFLGDRYAARRPGWRLTLSAIGLAVGAVGVAIFGIGLPLPIAIAGFLLLNVGFASSLPSIAAAIADLSPNALRGQSFALFQFIATAASATGPLVLGFVSDQTGIRGLAFVACVIPLIYASVIGFKGRVNYKSDEERVINDAISTKSGPEVV